MKARSLAALCLGVCLCACARSPASNDEPARVELPGRKLACPAPADVGSDCADVGDERVCWTGPLASDVKRVERPLPWATSERGFRCAGYAAARTCEDRRYASDPFVCSGALCTQRHPRMPDDGEWECGDIEGVVVCRGWAEAAGVVAGTADPGWFCGPRRGAKSERICVDFAPDRPAGGEFNCRFQYEPGQPLRACTRGGAAPIGRSCEGACPFGTVCASERCLPLTPSPACWLDKDCEGGQKCVHGSCRGLPS